MTLGTGRGVGTVIGGGVNCGREDESDSGFTVGKVIGPPVEPGVVAARGVGAVTGFTDGLATVFGGVVVIGFAVETADGLLSGVGIGVFSRNGVADSMGAGIKGNVSVSDESGEEVGVSVGSGAAVASGRIVAVGDDFGFALGEDLTVAVGEAFGLAVADGDSLAGGLRDWNGVDAASCALTRAVEMSNTVAKTSRRMMTFLTEI